MRSHVVSFFVSSEGDTDNFVIDGDLFVADLKGAVNALEDSKKMNTNVKNDFFIFD